MRRGTRRHGVAAAVGGAVGLGWWLYFRVPEEVCTPTSYGCGFIAVVLLPLLPFVSWLAAWAALRRLRVDRPGITAAAGLLVALLVVAVVTVIDTKRLYTGPDVPGYLSLTAMGALSFLVGALLTHQRVYRE
ncbi:hypothetical protein [Saccharothrix hoggarensis]|uniref:Secreted protein with PEP-CTERM sorting signal n=1 Tax=Saccharothrix hoggarensis TaxID=913853 RepID=A0ABW3QF24_9PSEU